MATTASTMGTRGGAADSLPPTDVVLALAAKRWAAAHAAAIRRAEAAIPALCEPALGGTAVGTGLNTTEGYGDREGDWPAVCDSA